MQSECHVYGSVNKKQVDCMVDTGADVTLLSSKIWDHIKEKLELEDHITARRIVGVEDSPLQTRGTAEVQLQLQIEQFNVQVVVVDGLATDIVLGRDFLQENKCVVDVGNNTLHLRNQDVREKYDNGAGKRNRVRETKLDKKRGKWNRTRPAKVNWKNKENNRKKKQDSSRRRNKQPWKIRMEVWGGCPSELT